MTWSDVSDETSYNVQRKIGPSGSWQTMTPPVPADITQYTESGLQADTEYFYRVRATNAAGSSAYSESQRVTTGPAVLLDLDIDSDNTSSGAPERTAEEELIENDATQPGKIIVVNDTDVDGDGIPDFADGFNLDGQSQSSDDLATGLNFIQIVLTMPSSFSPAVGTMTLSYSASNPATTTFSGGYIPASGSLRIWTKNGDVQRKPGSIVDRQLGEEAFGFYVPGGIVYSGQDAFQKLALNAGESTTFYVEAVRPSTSLASLTITVDVDPDGPGILDPVQDTIRITAVQASPTYYGDPLADAPGGIAFGADGGDPAALAYSGPVRYFDGTITYTSTDLGPSESGLLSGQTRTWTNRLAQVVDAVNGNGSVISQWPALIQAGSCMIAVGGGRTTRWFDRVGTAYQPRFYGQDKLEASGNGYVLTDTLANKIYYHGFVSSIPAAQRGRIDKLVDPAGNETQFNYGTDGQLQNYERKQGTAQVLERLTYSYRSDGKLTGATQERLTQGSLHVIRQVIYEYYGSGATGGKQGDLARVTITQGDPDSPNAASVPIERKLYRYDTSSGRLKYVVEGASYEQLAADPGTVDPLTTSDSQISRFADYYFEYTSGKVSAQTVKGLGRMTYIYSTNSDKTGTNVWRYKTTETLPGGNQNIIYMNHVGEVLVSVFKEGTKYWRQAYEYGKLGRLELSGQPSAVQNTSEAQAHPAVWNTTAGLVGVLNYYDSSETGWAPGYLKGTSIKQGKNGSSILQDVYQYSKRPLSDTYVPSKQIVYIDDAAQRHADTIFTYDYANGGNSDKIKTRTTRLPEVSSTTQNGSGSSAYVTEELDAYGHVMWLRDGDNRIHYTEYDLANGALVKSIADVDTNNPNCPSGSPWTTVGTGLHLTTLVQLDQLGRTSQITDPMSQITTISYPVQTAALRETRTTPPTTTGQVSPPIQVLREDLAHGYVDTATLGRNGALLAFSRSTYNNLGQLVSLERYESTVGGTYQASTGATSLGQRYLTEYGYDAQGRQDRVKDPLGTITRAIYDGLGRVLSIWIGTNDEGWNPANAKYGNLVKVSENQYDDGSPGDGNLTRVVQFTSSSDTISTGRVTLMWYDWRDRLIASKSGAKLNSDGTQAIGSETDSMHRPIIYSDLDNLGRATASYIYDGDGQTISKTNGVPNKPASSLLRAKSGTDYNDLGRVYRAYQHDIDQSNGSDLGFLQTDAWYDQRGNVIKTKQPGGLVTKFAYDGAGRVIKQSITDGGASALSPEDTTWADAWNVNGDIVLEQVETAYDPNGNPTWIVTKQRYHDGTHEGDLGIGNARISFAGNWYDEANRLTATVNFGNHGDDGDSNGDDLVDFTKPQTVPSRKHLVNGNLVYYDGWDEHLVTEYSYDDAGRLEFVTSPRDIRTRYSYDSLGRRTRVTEAYEDGYPSGDTDRITRYFYNGNDQVTRIESRTFEPGPGGGTQPRTFATVYSYGVVKDGSKYFVNHNGLLREIVYGAVTYAPPGYLDHEVFAGYNALGELTEKSDRNGTTHAYAYDALGRMTSDTWVNSGSAPGDMARIYGKLAYAYDALGRGVLYTSYGPSGPDPLNQVKRVYDGLGNLVREYQAHDGAVIETGGDPTPSVQYVYDIDYSADFSRLQQTIYPNGRVLWTGYDDNGLNNAISRVGYLADSNYIGGQPTTPQSTALEAYGYLGLARVVIRDFNRDVSATPGAGQFTESYVGADLLLTPEKDDAGPDDPYDGLDRFGRIVAHGWDVPNARTYAYDADGHTLYAWAGDNIDAKWRSDLFQADGVSAREAYDRLGRLEAYQRGVLSDSDGNGRLDTAQREEIVILDVPWWWTPYYPTPWGDMTVITQYRTQNWTASTSTSANYDRIPGPTDSNDPDFDNDGPADRHTYQSGVRASDERPIATAYPDPNRTDLFVRFDAWGRLIHKNTATRHVIGGNSITGWIYSYAASDSMPVDAQQFEYDALGRRIAENRTVNDGSTISDRGRLHLYYDAAGNVLEERLQPDEISAATVKTQYVWSEAGPKLMVVRDADWDGSIYGDYGLPAGGLDERYWVMQGPDASVWQIKDNDWFAGVEQYLYTPEGQVQVLKLTYKNYRWYDWILDVDQSLNPPYVYESPNGNTNYSPGGFRYLWQGARAEVFAEVSQTSGQLLDKFDGLLWLDGREHDTWRGAPLMEDVYAYQRSNDEHFEWTAVNTVYPHNGAGGQWAGTSTSTWDAFWNPSRYQAAVGDVTQPTWVNVTSKVAGWTGIAALTVASGGLAGLGYLAAGTGVGAVGGAAYSRYTGSDFWSSVEVGANIGAVVGSFPGALRAAGAKLAGYNPALRLPKLPRPAYAQMAAEKIVSVRPTASSALTRIGRFFYDTRPFEVIRKEYWVSGAAGRSLHHWLLPQRATWVPMGFRNAGLNLMELPALRGVFHPTLSLNTWMGFAPKWGGIRAAQALVVANSIRVAVPASIAGGAYAGYELRSWFDRQVNGNR